MSSVFVSTLSFDVGQFFADETVLHLEYIDSSDVSLFSCRIHPFVSPAHNTPHTKASSLLDLDVGIPRLAEEVLPKLSYCFLLLVHSAVRGWIRVFEEAIVAHQLHRPCHIMTVEGLIELKHDWRPTSCTNWNMPYATPITCVPCSSCWSVTSKNGMKALAALRLAFEHQPFLPDFVAPSA